MKIFLFFKQLKSHIITTSILTDVHPKSIFFLFLIRRVLKKVSFFKKKRALTVIMIIINQFTATLPQLIRSFRSKLLTHLNVNCTVLYGSENFFIFAIRDNHNNIFLHAVTYKSVVIVRENVFRIPDREHFYLEKKFHSCF